MAAYAELMAQQTSIPTVDVSFSAHLQPYLGLMNIVTALEPSSLPAMDIYTTVIQSQYGRQGDFYTGSTQIMGKSVANAFGGG
jgi:hypothetical protein